MAGTDVFLSYPHKDQAAVLALAEALKGAGLSIWLDSESVEVFERIHDRVARGIATSKVVLAWYSCHYANSRPCQWELAAGWLANDGERVLAVNPELDAGHIRPATLLQRLYANADDLAALAQQVKSQVVRFETAMGEGVTYGQPLHYGRELAGLNTFVGRMEQLWDLHDALAKAGAAMLTGEIRSVAQLRGFGGIGKSALAEEYALRFGAAYPGGIFWLKAYGNADGYQSPADRDAERLRQIADFAARLNIPVAGKQSGEIRTALGQLMASGRRGLWIVDDLPSGLTQEQASAWLSPHASVPTLITTRDRSLARLGKPMDVDVLSRGESMELLSRHIAIAESERKAAEELADELGYHVLALEVAGSYLQMRAGEPIEEFLEDLRSPDDDVLEQAAELADALPLEHSPSIVATLKTTIDRLSEPARDLLCLASCVAAAPIPPELIASVLARLMNLPAKEADFERLKATKETDRYGLTEPEKSRREAVSVHALVARTARRHPSSTGRIDLIRDAAVLSLTESLESMYTVGTILRLNLEVTHARKMAAALDTLAAGELLVLVANTDLLRGDLDAAEHGALRASEFCASSREIGPDAIETYKARAGVAAVALAKRDVEQAAAIYEDIGPVLEAKLPPGNRYRNGVAAGLAIISAVHGDIPAAMRRLQTLLQEIEGAADLNEQVRLGPKRLLLQSMTIVGDTDGANKLLKEIAAADARIADDNGIDALVDQFLTVPTMLSGGDVEGATRVTERAAEVFAKNFGEDSVLTLQAKSYLLTLMSIRQDSRTRTLAEDLVPRFERVFGPNNPATLEARASEAQALMMAKDANEAQKILEATLPPYEKVFGATDTSVLTMKVSLAQARCENKDYGGAIRLLNSVIPSAEEAKASFVLLNATACKAICLFRSNDRCGEKDAWERVLAMQKAMFGVTHPSGARDRGFAELCATGVR